MPELKILLINTPQENSLPAGVEDDFIDIIGHYPPLGLLYLATVLDEKKYDVKILDCTPMGISYSELEEEIRNYHPNLVGITTYTTSMYDILKTAELVKSIDSEIITLLGGHHPTLYPRESASYKQVDFILQGEAEETIVELVEAIEKKVVTDEFKKIRGIGFRDGENIFVHRIKPVIQDLDRLPIINREFLPSEVYQSIIGKHSKVATVMSSRGCPFKCTFCFSPSKKYRSRSNENILREIKYLQEKGFKEIFFFDDLFALQEAKVIEFSRMLREQNIQIDWSFRARISTITQEMINEVAQSGCHRIQFGIESGVDSTLERIRKETNPQQISRAVAMCQKAGIQTVGSFIIGLPDETAENIQETIRFSRKIGLNYAQYNILIPYPFTQIYEEGLAKGYFTHDYWQEFADDPLKNTKKFKVQYWTKEVSEAYLFETVKKAFKKFYFRPTIIFHKLKEIRNFQELKNSIIGAFSVMQFKPNQNK